MLFMSIPIGRLRLNREFLKTHEATLGNFTENRGRHKLLPGASLERSGET